MINERQGADAERSDQGQLSKADLPKSELSVAEFIQQQTGLHVVDETGLADLLAKGEGAVPGPDGTTQIQAALLGLPQMDEGYQLPSGISKFELSEVYIKRDKSPVVFWQVVATYAAVDQEPDSKAGRVLLADSFHIPEAVDRSNSDAMRAAEKERDARIEEAYGDHRLIYIPDPSDVFHEATCNLDLEGGEIEGGIGPYEYWGQRGFHSQKEVQVSSGDGAEAIYHTLDFPELEESGRAQASAYVVTYRAYCEATDDEVDDGYDIDVDLKGELKKVTITPFTVKHEGQDCALWEVSAVYGYYQE